MSKKVAVMVADGAEPVEVIAPVDAWRRGGVDVTLVSIMGRKLVEMAQGVRVEADALLEDVTLTDFDGLFIPGGNGGVENLLACDAVADALRTFAREDRYVFSICAGPMVLNAAGILEGRRVTCYPGCEEGFPTGAYAGQKGVVQDGHLITGAGPAFALSFGLVCLAALTTQSTADEVGSGMLAT